MNDQLPTAWGESVVHARLKSTPTDFRVDEQLDIPLDGVGEHLYLRVRKQALNSQDVADWLRQRFAVTTADIGFCGLKDKQAITDQWFSVRTPLTAPELDKIFAQRSNQILGQTASHPASHPASHLDGHLDTHPDSQSVTHSDSQSVTHADSHPVGQHSESPQPSHASINDSMGNAVTLLDCQRHRRKLRRGAHRANRFDITLREVRSITGGDYRAHVSTRLACIAKSGFPNYFGPQRFGFNAANLTGANELISGKRKRVTRRKRGFYLSAMRSALFNEVCAARVAAGSWQTLLQGEPAMLSGTKSYFIHDGTDPSVAMRLARLDVHPSGPLCGRGETSATGACASIESAVLNEHLDAIRWLAEAGLAQERRALRAQASGLQWDWLDKDTLRIQVELEKGVYATSLLAELMPRACLN